MGWCWPAPFQGRGAAARGPGEQHSEAEGDHRYDADRVQLPGDREDDQGVGHRDGARDDQGRGRMTEMRFEHLAGKQRDDEVDDQLGPTVKLACSMRNIY